MKPINRQDKLNQRELIDLDRQAQDRILELRLHEALARAIKPLQSHRPLQPLEIKEAPLESRSPIPVAV